MPTALVPYNRFANAQSHGVQSSFEAPSKPNPPFATFQHDEKAITFHNIADGNLLQVAAPSVEGAPDMKMTVHKTDKRNTFRAKYTPSGYSYRVMAAYAGKPMQGFPVTFSPKAPYVEQNIPSREFKIHNVYQPNLVSVHTATLPHAAEYDENNNVVTVKFNPAAMPGMHDVHVQYKDEDMPNSRFRLMPRPQPQATMVPMYTTGAYGGGAYPQLTAGPTAYAQPMHAMPAAYAQPMQAVPAHMMQAGAAPMLMAPVQMVQQPGGQPMLMVPQQQQQQQAPLKAVAGNAPMMRAAPMMQTAPMMQAAPMQSGYYAPYPQQ